MELTSSLPEGKLIKYCEEIWHTYNHAATTPDTHVEECLAKWKIEDPKDNKFVQQVFTGLVRYKKLIGVFIQAFYFAKGGEVSRTDVDTYSVFAYLTLLRLKELQYVAFRKLILAQVTALCSVATHLNDVYARICTTRICTTYMLRIFTYMRYVYLRICLRPVAYESMLERCLIVNL